MVASPGPVAPGLRHDDPLFSENPTMRLLQQPVAWLLSVLLALTPLLPVQAAMLDN